MTVGIGARGNVNLIDWPMREFGNAMAAGQESVVKMKLVHGWR